MATVEMNAGSLGETLAKGGILLLDCWAPWCGPCRAFAPIYERVAARHPDIVFGKLNTEQEPELAARFGITAIPTLMVIKDKTLLFSQAGLLPERALEELVQQARQIDLHEVKKQAAAAAPAPEATSAN